MSARAIIAQLRELRAARPGFRDFRITSEELDALLAVAAERDDLQRRLVGDWEGEINNG